MKVLVTVDINAADVKQAEIKARAVMMGAQTSLPEVVKGFTGVRM